MRLLAKSKDSIFDTAPRLQVPLVLYLIAVIFPISFSLGSVSFTGVRVFLIFLTVPLVVNLLRGQYGPLRATDVLFFIYVGWVAVSLAVNNPNKVIENAGSTGLEFIGGYLVGRAYVRYPSDFLKLVIFLSLFLLIHLPFIIYEGVTGDALLINFISNFPGILSWADMDIGKRLWLYRSQGIFFHPIHWGVFCALILPLCLIGLKEICNPFWYIAMSVAIGLSGFLALSSGSLLAIILQGILISWAWIFRNTNKRWLLITGFLLLLYIVVDLLSNRTPIRVALYYLTFSAHTAYWRTIIFEWGMYNVWQNPIFGIGLNEWVRPYWMFSGSMDNFWLVTTVRHGIPAFVFLATGYLIALWKIGRRNFDHDLILWHIRRAWMFSFVGITFVLATVHIWQTIYSFTFFMFGAGIWMLDINIDQRREELIDETSKSHTQERSFSRRFEDASSFNEKEFNDRKPVESPPAKPKFPYSRF